MAKSAIRELEQQGIRASDAFARFPMQVTTDDLETADYIVALQESEHLPLLEERHPASIEKVEFWDVDDAPGIFGLIEQEVLDLTSRLLGGAKRRESAARGVTAPETALGQEATLAQPKGAIVKVGRETKGRRGQGVTTVFDLPVDAAGLAELASKLKQKCGAGGAVKDGRVEIQGDQRERVIQELEQMGYQVKRVGG
jgi:translation initiation factor 1